MTSPVAILAIADIPLRNRLSKTLQGLRWQVLSAAGGAEALSQLESGVSSAVIADAWLPDLEIAEFLSEVEASYPEVDLISTDGSFERSARTRNSRRGELLYALRVSQDRDGTPFRLPFISKIADPGANSNTSKATKDCLNSAANGTSGSAFVADADKGKPNSISIRRCTRKKERLYRQVRSDRILWSSSIHSRSV